MKTLKRLFFSLFISFILAGALGLGIQTSQHYDVQEGFAYGSPSNQQFTAEKGSFHVKRFGFPATYKETQSVHLDSGATGSYESKPFSFWLAVVNVVFWMSLLVAILSPISIFFRPKKKTEKPAEPKNEVKPTEEKLPSQDE